MHFYYNVSITILYSEPVCLCSYWSSSYISRSRRDRWGTTEDLTANSLQPYLSSASLKASPSFKPDYSRTLSSHLFLCLPLALGPCPVPCRIDLASPFDRNTYPYHRSLRGFFLTLVRRSSKGPIECCISFLTSSLVMWSLYKMPRSLWKHLISVACILFSRSLVKAHDSQAYRNMEKTKEHINLIMELSVMFLSLQVILSFVSAAIVCAILAITSNFEIWSVTHYYFELQFVVNCVSYVKDFIHPEIHHQRRNF